MEPIGQGFYSIHFSPGQSWKSRVVAWIRRALFGEPNPFIEANAEVIAGVLQSRESGVRAVVNIPADALLSFLREGTYKNAYGRPVVAGRRREPSDTRLRVDGLLGFGKRAPEYYFAAVALGGTGIRFYGEYCMVLRPEWVRKSTQVFDRNSYDLVHSPLSSVSDEDGLVSSLRGEWATDLVDMLKLKILPILRGVYRLTTAGAISDAVLHDEDFVEVHHRGSFLPDDVEEIRLSPEDEVVQSRIAQRYSQGILPTAEELLWSSRRAVVTEELQRHKVASRVVVSSGRGNRWR